MSFTVPDACALPTAEQPVRLAEFDTLFATAVRRVESLSPTHVRLRLIGPSGLEATVRDLTARETECCSFFVFTITRQSADGEALILDMEVPPAAAFAHTDYRDVRVYAGGKADWADAGLPFEGTRAVPRAA